jgi:polar amino acid transport system substrate-binding protein
MMTKILRGGLQGFLFIAAVFLFLFPGRPVQAQQPLIIGTSYKLLLSTPEQNGLLDTIAKEAFSRIGIQIELPFLPAERSLIAASTGLHDGELNRVAGLEKLYPNLIRIDESMMHFRFVAFTRTCRIPTPDWQSLAPYRIGIIKGWKILEENAGKFDFVTYVNSAQQLFTLLALDRIDIALYGDLLGQAQLQAMGIDNYTILEPPLAVHGMYMYLHKKHQRLVPQVREALHAMKADGTYGRLYLEVQKSLLTERTKTP